ncbi:MAG: B12-binding domain-containing radical SAM protein [Planctomycetes bacterium]|nr:B12-binding domain-containing radical SAM protein [Planctomycetota bacterium]
MKALLVQPVAPRARWPRGSFRSRWVPTGLAYLAAALRRAGHQVRIHSREEQLIKDRFDWDRADAGLRSLFEEFRPEAIGLSVTTPFMPEAAELAKLAKEVCGKETLVVIGGPHATALPEQTLDECAELDAVVIGEGEHALVELLERGPRGDVAGICYRKDGGCVRTAPRAPERDLDSLGPPPYDLFDMEHYAARDRWLIRWLPLRATNLRTSRGCPNTCHFCAGHLVSGLGVRFHSVAYVVEQMRLVVERFGVEAIHFEDDTIGASRPRLTELCGAIRQAGLHRRVKWDALLRANQADPEVLREMKAAGCIQVEFGFECGSDAMLRALGKNTTVEMNVRAARLAHEAGLRIYADIMVGLPGETEDDLRATLRFVRKTRPEVVSFARLYPLPGTTIYNTLSDADREKLTWAAYTYLEDADLPVNITAIPTERFAQLYREIDKYWLRPALAWELYRDTPRQDAEGRRELRRRVLRFCLLHPLRALRVPW